MQICILCVKNDDVVNEKNGPKNGRRSQTQSPVYRPLLGVKVRNMKMDFNTGSTWHRVGQ